MRKEPEEGRLDSRRATLEALWSLILCPSVGAEALHEHHSFTRGIDFPSRCGRRGTADAPAVDRLQTEGYAGNDEQLGAEPPAESATRFCHPNVAKFMAPYADDSRSGLKKILEENQMEIARILREVQALWSAMGSFGTLPT